MIYDSILFDLDGTLWDSTTGVQKSWAAVAAQHPASPPIPTEADIQGIMGLTPDDVTAKLFPDLPLGQRREIFQDCVATENEYLAMHGGSLYPELTPTLKILSQKIPLFIVSNCGVGYIESFLEAHQLHGYFKDWESAGATGLSKGENIRLVTTRNHLKQPVYVGDTQSDYDAAQKAQIPFIFAAYGFGFLPANAQAIRIRQFSDLLNLSFPPTS